MCAGATDSVSVQRTPERSAQKNLGGHSVTGDPSLNDDLALLTSCASCVFISDEMSRVLFEV